MTVNNLKEVEDLIKELELDTPCRSRENAYSRFVIYSHLRNSGFTYQKIGDLFNRKHDTVLKGVRKYNELNENAKSYPDFALIRDSILRVLNLNIKLKKKVVLSNLENRILNCNNYFEMRQLQEDLKKDIEEREDENIFTTFDI